MSDVSISIAGRQYKVACGEGEEGHIAKLGRVIDAKLSDMPNLASQSESRTLLFASLLLADEVHEARQTTETRSIMAEDGDQKVAEMLEAFAERMETLASRLESEATAS